MSGAGELPGSLRGPWAGLTGEELATRWSVPLVETWTRLGSTNDRAAELARSGDSDRAGGAEATLVVIAEEQTRGRGRRGAAWRSAPGSGIWMSVLLASDALDPALPLAVGAAAAEGIEAVAGAYPSVGVKWPNDLLVDGRKVGGVLCEGAAGRVVVGLGLNVSAESVHGDPSLTEVATALEVTHGKTLSRIELADAILGRILASVSGSDPLGAAHASLLRRDVLRGRRLVSETHGAGVGAGVAEDGALLVERDGERVRAVSGSVRRAQDSGSA